MKEMYYSQFIRLLYYIPDILIELSDNKRTNESEEKEYTTTEKFILSKVDQGDFIVERSLPASTKDWLESIDEEEKSFMYKVVNEIRYNLYSLTENNQRIYVRDILSAIGKTSALYFDLNDGKRTGLGEYISKIKIEQEDDMSFLDVYIYCMGEKLKDFIVILYRLCSLFGIDLDIIVDELGLSFIKRVGAYEREFKYNKGTVFNREGAYLAAEEIKPYLTNPRDTALIGELLMHGRVKDNRIDIKNVTKLARFLVPLWDERIISRSFAKSINELIRNNFTRDDKDIRDSTISSALSQVENR